MLLGKFVRLRVMESTDAEYVRRLRNSPAVVGAHQDRSFISDLQQQSFLRSVAKSSTQKYFIAENAVTLSPFGVYSTRNIDHRNQRGENGVFIDDAQNPSGIDVYEAAFLLLHYAFGYLNLHKVCAEVLADNKRGLRFNEGLGMKPEGLRQRHVFYDGKFHDVVELAMFRDDFYQRPTPAMQLFVDGRAELQPDTR